MCCHKMLEMSTMPTVKLTGCFYSIFTQIFYFFFNFLATVTFHHGRLWVVCEISKPLTEAFIAAVY